MYPNLKRNPDGHRGPAAAREAGAVLLLVLLILALISVMILSWAQEWRMELKLAANFRDTAKCRRLAEAGIYYGLGKLAESMMAEAAVMLNPGMAPRVAGWQGDQRPHQLKLPEGAVEVRLEDEGGKINLNRVPADILTKLLLSLRVPPAQVRTMVDSVQDWRGKEAQPRPFGAKSDFYLHLDPPYVAKMGLFETVEELSWVHGFEGSPLIPRLGELLTVQQVSLGVNINTASPEVLYALGLPSEVVRTIIAGRQSGPFRNVQEIAQMMQLTQMDPSRMLTIQPAPFFTIKSTGMINKQGARHTIKAIVRMDLSLNVPWEVLSWDDDFPG